MGQQQQQAKVHAQHAAMKNSKSEVASAKVPPKVPPQRVTKPKVTKPKVTSKKADSPVVVLRTAMSTLMKKPKMFDRMVAQSDPTGLGVMPLQKFMALASKIG